MCGIFGLFFVKGDYNELKKRVLKLLKRLLPRGPDATGFKHYEVDGYHHFICHQRLSIVDPFGGDQPFYGQIKKTCSVTNGEIYNHEGLRKNLRNKHEFLGHSDCEIIPYLYDDGYDMKEISNMFSGMFATILLDTEENRLFVSRDHLGIIPCYMGRGKNGEIYVASELKAIHDYSTSIDILLPGHYYDSQTKEQIRWWNPIYYQPNYLPIEKVDLTVLREKLISAVRNKMMSDVPFGVLLSGGLDSSLIASITKRLYKEYINKYEDQLIVHSPVLSSFSIGLKDSPDLVAAREAAKHIGTKHYEFVFTVEEGLNVLSDVIYTIETFNPTTIRASIPMYLMARRIKTLGIKMVLSGEGSDELMAGYLYFHKAPNSKELYEETVRKLQDLYKYDLLRANKTTAGWGVECRPPFLDKDFIDYVMTIDPECKMVNKEHMNIEKWVLRKAFDVEDDPYLPKKLLYRQKEQFSDGVGYGWIDGLKVSIYFI